MIKVYRNSNISIHKNYIDIDLIKQDLTRVYKPIKGDAREMLFYDSSGDYIQIPRYYPLDNYKDIYIEDLTTFGDDININSSIVPRDDRQHKTIEWLVNQRCAVLKSETGSGKSVMAIATIARIKKRTIILVHKSPLIKHWKSEFLKYTNLTDDDIGILSNNNYLTCLKKSIILATPQTITYAIRNSKDDFINKLQTSGIGVCIIDEVHIGVGPEKFSQVSMIINAYRTYGLSATPNRLDGNTDIIHHHLGDLQYFEPKKEDLLKAKIFVKKFDYDIFNKHRKYICYGGKFDYQKYYNMMRKSDIFLKETKNIIKNAYEKGRNILILGANIKTLFECGDIEDIPVSDIGFFIPSIKTNSEYKKMAKKLSDTIDLEEAFFKKRIVFSTYGAARDGNNREDLDTLIMITPTSNPEQAIGRILRKFQNKKEPLVVELIDTTAFIYHKSKYDSSKKVSIFEKSFEKRLDLYTQKEWEVVNLK